MRLQTQLQMIETALATMPKVTLTRQPSSYFTAPGKAAYLQGLLLLREIPYLADYVSGLLARHELQTGGDEFVVAEATEGHIQSMFQAFRARVELAGQILATAVSAPASDTMLAVRLPPMGLIDETETALGNLKTSLAAIVLQPEVEGRKLELVGFDTGSAWVIIELGSKIALGLVGAVLVVVYTVNKIRTQNSQARGYVSAADGSADVVAAATAATDNLINLLVREHVKALNDKYYGSRQGHFEELRHSIETLAALIDRGTKIEPAKLSPMKIENPFPDVDKLIEATTPKLLKAPEKE